MNDVGTDEQSGPAKVLVDLSSFEHVPLAPRPRTRAPLSSATASLSSASRPPQTASRGDGDRAALSTIGRLAREGRISLCTYVEFDAPGPPSDWNSTWRQLLGDVPVAPDAPAIDRAALGEDVFRDAAQPGALARLCARLKLAESHAKPAAREAPAPTDAAAAEHGVPRELERFRELAARVQGPHLADLFHLWSAERAGCVYWLTLDDALGTFVRDWVNPGLGQPLRCEVVLPNQLLERLGVAERDSLAGYGERVVALQPRPPRE